MTTTHQEALERFREKFLSDEFHMNSDDKLTIGLETFLLTEIEASYTAGQQNPKVGFLRQYLNESAPKTHPWTNEQILGFLRIPFKEDISS